MLWSLGGIYSRPDPEPLDALHEWGVLLVVPGGIRGVFRDAPRTLGCGGIGIGIGLDPRVRWDQTVVRVQDQSPAP